MPTNEKRDQTDFQREQAVFLAAVEATTPTDRNAVLDRECGDDAGLRRRVEALLAAHDAEGSLPPAGAAVDETCALESMPGAMIAARYKLLEEIGEGGMGVVWMAEQRVPVRRLVAVKLIKAGMDSKSVIARFEAERQALAMMDHPNIARVFDGGMTEQGRPYFAMELVRGLPVTQYCDQRRMTVHDRLLVFTQICHAVQHAHQKGIIHRDIKPNNVLVAEHDGEPVPKVIDFGLAKALGGSGVLTEHTLYTAFGQMAGTPLYTAPEQVAINSLDIDTRADIYALGVLLYELLTGSPPLDRERLKEAAWDEICRVIREEEPPRPSTRLSTSMILPNLAASRQTEPAKLCGLIRGDLDWIVLKALEKERHLRYDTATALVADIERHLNDEPVVAAPPTVGYRARKFVKKHKTGVFTGAAGATLLTLGLTTTTWQWIRADNNAKAAARNERIAEVQRIEADKLRDAAELEAYIAKIGSALTAMEHNSWPEARRRLDACPPSRRGFEWRFLWEKAQSVFSAQYTGGKSITISPDRRFWVREIDSHSVHVMDFSFNSVGDPIKTDEAIDKANFSPNGRLVVTLYSEKAQLWGFDGKSVGFIEKTDNYSVFSPDGQHLLTRLDDRTTQLRHVSGQNVGEAMKHAAPIWISIFSPEGRLVITICQGGTARLWDLAGKPVGDPLPDGSVNAAEFSPNGNLLVTLSNNKARLWDRNGKPVGNPMEHKGSVTSVCFSPDGRLVLTASSGEGAPRLWDLNGRSVGELSENQGSIDKASFSPDGSLILTTSTYDNTVRLWDINARPVGEPMLQHYVQLWMGSSSLSASFTRDSRRVVTSDSKQIAVWDLQGRQVGVRAGNSMVVCAVDPNGDNFIVTEGTYTEPSTINEFIRIDHLDSPVVDVDLDVSLAQDEIAKLNSINRQSSAALAASAPARNIRFPPKENAVELAAPGHDPVVLHHDQAVTAAAVSPDGLCAVTSTGQIVRFWDIASGREIAEIPAKTDVNDLKFTPDGTRLILLMNGGVQIWDSRPYEERQKDRDARFAEFKPARQYVDQLLTTNTSYGQLEDAIRKDESLNAVRKVQAMGWLRYMLMGIDNRAEAVFDKIKVDALNRIDMHEKLANAECPPRVAERVEKSIAEWKEPTGKDLEKAAMDIFAKSGLSARRYTSAFKSLAASVGSEPTNPDSLFTLAMGNYRIGQFEDAVKNMTHAVDLEYANTGGVNRAGWAVIAMAQFELGRIMEARQALAKMPSGVVDPPVFIRYPQLEAEAISLIEPEPLPETKKLMETAFERWSWSPDGKQIVYVSYATEDASPTMDLRILDLQTNQSREFLKDAHDPAWSPGEGRWIVFERRPNEDSTAAQIWLVPSAGGEPKKLCDGTFPTWSADGKSLYFYSHKKQKLLTINVDEPSAVPTEFAEVDWYYPAISPDGNRIVFFADENLTILDRKTGQTVLALPLEGWIGLLTSWSPDGKQIAYGSYGMDSSDGLWIYDFEAKRQVKVADGPWTMPIWSPDGSKFTFQLRGPKISSIWIVDSKTLLETAAKLMNPPATDEKAKKSAEKPVEK